MVDPLHVKSTLHAYRIVYNAPLMTFSNSTKTSITATQPPADLSSSLNPDLEPDLTKISDVRLQETIDVRPKTPPSPTIGYAKPAPLPPSPPPPSLHPSLRRNNVADWWITRACGGMGTAELGGAGLVCTWLACDSQLLSGSEGFLGERNADEALIGR